ncbi:hypothetical protein CCP1ISM_40009 [Azospirillaceae bacterium]
MTARSVSHAPRGEHAIPQRNIRAENAGVGVRVLPATLALATLISVVSGGVVATVYFSGGLVVIWMEIKMALIPCKDIYSFVRKNDLYMIKSTKIVYYYYDQVDHAWKPISKSGVEQTACVAESKNKGERTLVDFYNLLENEERVAGRVYRGLTEAHDALNIFVKANWLKPLVNTTYPPHPFFDILMTSLAGGRQEYKDRLEQLLLKKIYCPHNITIPALVMWGHGDVGKYTFYKLLDRIFGGNETNTVKPGPDKVFTKFNTIIEGKVVIYFDECECDEALTEKLKEKITEETVITEAKYGPPVINQNMTWWIVSKNSKVPVRLAGDIKEDGTGGYSGEDRRWFVIRQQHDLTHWVAESADYKVYSESGRYPTITKYVTDRRRLLDDPIAIQHWLGSLVVKHGEPQDDGKLFAIYGTDYWDAVNISNELKKDPQERFAETIFSTGYFNKMQVDALFKAYKDMGNVKPENISAFGKMLLTYVTDKNLSSVWAKDDSNRAYWYRRIDDGIERKDIALNFDAVSVNIQEYINDHFRSKGVAQEPLIEPADHTTIDAGNWEAASRKRRQFYNEENERSTAAKKISYNQFKAVRRWV